MLVNKNNNTKKSGFTLVEMAIVAPILILTIGTFIYAIVMMTGDVMASRASNKLAYDMQYALNQIEADVKISGGFLDTSFTPTSPQGLNDTASPFSNSALILNTYATTDNPLSPSRNIVYTNNPNICASGLAYQNQPLMLNTVYFVKNSTLWRRVIMPSDYATTANYCGTTWQQPSCSPGWISSFCKTNDERLIEGLDTTNGFQIAYNKFAGSDKTGAVTVAINIKTTAAGRAITRSGTISATSLNQ